MKSGNPQWGIPNRWICLQAPASSVTVRCASVCSHYPDSLIQTAAAMPSRGNLTGNNYTCMSVWVFLWFTLVVLPTFMLGLTLLGLGFLFVSTIFLLVVISGDGKDHQFDNEEVAVVNAQPQHPQTLQCSSQRSPAQFPRSPYGYGPIPMAPYVNQVSSARQQTQNHVGMPIPAQQPRATNENQQTEVPSNNIQQQVAESDADEPPDYNMVMSSQPPPPYECIIFSEVCETGQYL